MDSWRSATSHAGSITSLVSAPASPIKSPSPEPLRSYRISQKAQISSVRNVPDTRGPSPTKQTACNGRTTSGSSLRTLTRSASSSQSSRPMASGQRSVTSPQRSLTSPQRSLASQRSLTTSQRSLTSPQRSLSLQHRSATSPLRSPTSPPQRSISSPQRSITSPNLLKRQGSLSNASPTSSRRGSNTSLSSIGSTYSAKDYGTRRVNKGLLGTQSNPGSRTNLSYKTNTAKRVSRNHVSGILVKFC